jgi:hypothetical protein
MSPEDITITPIAAAGVTYHLHKFLRGRLQNGTVSCGFPQATEVTSGAIGGAQQNQLGSGRLPHHAMLRLWRRQIERTGVGDYYIGAQFMHFTQALGRVVGFADHSDVRFVLQQSAQTLPQEHMVMHEQATNLRIEGNYFP